MNIHAEIEDTVIKMRALLEKAGVKVERKLFLSPLRDRVQQVCADEALAWITDIFIKEYAEALKVRKLVTEQMWAQYDIFPEDYADHQECVLWTAAAKKLREKVNSALRPDYFKKASMDRLIKRGNRGGG